MAEMYANQRHMAFVFQLILFKYFLKKKILDIRRRAGLEFSVPTDQFLSNGMRRCVVLKERRNEPKLYFMKATRSRL